MSNPAWTVSGQYYETCSCDFVCPCVLTQLSGTPSKDSCTFAMGFQIERGRYGDLSLDGLGFVVVGFTPAEMSKGNWTVGLIVDERARPEQRDAIVAVASGAAGGPMAALAGLIGTFAGVESAPIAFGRDGMTWSVNAASFVSMSAVPAMGIDPANPEPLQLANTGHPAAGTVSLARAAHSTVDVFGVAWADRSGSNNGQYAPFAWASA